jgi:hypothetical protein
MALIRQMFGPSAEKVLFISSSFLCYWEYKEAFSFFECQPNGASWLFLVAEKIWGKN